MKELRVKVKVKTIDAAQEKAHNFVSSLLTNTTL
jgi:hypothetical protein